MFRLVNSEEREKLESGIQLYLNKPSPPPKNKISPMKCNIGMYPIMNFRAGITVFDCYHKISYKRYVFDDIRLPADSDFDEQTVYFFIEAVIKAATGWARDTCCTRVVLKSRLNHFAEHLVDQKFNVYNRTIDSNNINIIGCKNI